MNLYPTPAAHVGCIAFTAERGWHFSTVDLAELLRCEREANGPRPVAERKAPQPCGTHAAYVRHGYNSETPCPACRLAERTYQRDRKRRQRAA